MEMIQTNKAKAMNELHIWCNEIVPLLIAELKKGFKVNADGNLSKKDKVKIDPLLKSSPFRAHLEFSKYSTWLKTDISYRTGEYSNDYYKLHFCVNSHDGVIPDFKPLKTDITAAYLDDIQSQIKNLEQQKNVIDSQIFDLKLKVGK
jgi:hypothetical protein